MKTPRFWQNKNYLSLLLWPLSIIYLAAFIIKSKLTKTLKISKKVICVGNLTMGGSGKTPTALAIGQILQEMKIDFAYLTRGYKGRNKEILFLDKYQQYDSTITGDEPLLLKELAPTIISKKRAKGALEIDKNKQLQAVILDDGMQNNSLHKDLTILVIDNSLLFGNNMIFPSGPLRQSIKSGLKEADLIVSIGNQLKTYPNLPHDKIVKACIVCKNAKDFNNHELLAFCGIAYPQKFFNLLKDNNLNVVDNISFPDHFKYSDKDLQKICQISYKKNLRLITTKKDWIKFPKKYQDKIEYLDIELIFDKPKLVKNKLQEILSN